MISNIQNSFIQHSNYFSKVLNNQLIIYYKKLCIIILTNIKPITDTIYGGGCNRIHFGVLFFPQVPKNVKNSLILLLNSQHKYLLVKHFRKKEDVEGNGVELDETGKETQYIFG